MSAITKISGLVGPGVLELRARPARRRRRASAHGVAEVERALAAVAALAGQAHGELAGERVDRLAEVGHLLPRGVHEVDVLGQRLAQRLGHGLDAPVGHQPAADLGLDLLLELVDPVLVLVVLEALLERAQRLGRVLPGLLHELLEHAVEIEVPQRAVQVVRAADGPARLHAGEALDGLAGQRPQHGVVALEQRLVEHRGELLGRQRIAPAAAGALLALGLVLVAVLAVGSPARRPCRATAYWLPRSEK